MTITNLSELNPLYNDPLSKRAYAVFLPAISLHFVDIFENAGAHLRHGSLPPSFGGDINALNFLDPANGKFFYKWALFSAGQAKMKPSEIATGADALVQKRDRSKTQIVGDSGGFQIASGAWKVNVTDRPAMDKLCDNVLRWQERTADVMMALDVPTAVLKGPNPQKLTFQQCLDCSVANNQYFERHRDTRLNRPILNVLQGNDWRQQQEWYNAVKDFPFEGWAFPFGAHNSVQRLLDKLLILHHDGKLKEAKRIHFLGLSRLRFAGALTLLMRFLREYANPEIVISFDASSPLIAAGMGGTAFHRWEYKKLGKEGDVTIASHGFSNDAKYIGSETPFPFLTSPIGVDLKMGDLYVAGLDKGATWDALSRMILAAHNIYVHVFSIAELNRMMDTALEKSFEPELPYQYSAFASCVEKMFRPGTDMASGRSIVNDYQDVLQWFDRKNTITVAQIVSGSKKPNWGTDDLEEFAMYREAPPAAPVAV